MIDEIYEKKVLTLSRELPESSTLAAPTNTATRRSKICGSTITVQLVIKDGIVTDYAHRMHGCVVTKAAATVIHRNIVGSTVAELRALQSDLHSMIKEGGDPPGGKWADFWALLPVREIKHMHTSATLVIDTIMDALDSGTILT